jgi:TrmH family RNA methyltransferase
LLTDSYCRFFIKIKIIDGNIQVSITNRQIKYIKLLQTKKGRKLYNQFTAEGIRLLEEALHQNFLPIKLLYSPNLLSERGNNLVLGFEAKSVDCIKVTENNINSVSSTNTPQGIIAVFDIPKINQIEPKLKKYRKILWCEDISDPGNMGTIIRSALAFGFNMLITTGSCADIYSPKVVRSSTGAIFKMNLWLTDNEKALNMAKKHKFVLFASSLKGENQDKVLKNIDKNTKLILAIGSESEGLSDKIISSADYKIMIRHNRSVESLNAAVAATIMMNSFYHL